jgi:hypothetical protein
VKRKDRLTRDLPLVPRLNDRPQLVLGLLLLFKLFTATQDERLVADDIYPMGLLEVGMQGFPVFFLQSDDGGGSFGWEAEEVK